MQSLGALQVEVRNCLDQDSGPQRHEKREADAGDW